jgi:hypothetical protein
MENEERRLRLRRVNKNASLIASSRGEPYQRTSCDFPSTERRVEGEGIDLGQEIVDEQTYYKRWNQLTWRVCYRGTGGKGRLEPYHMTLLFMRDQRF